MNQLVMFGETKFQTSEEAGRERMRQAFSRMEISAEVFYDWARKTARCICADRGEVSTDDLRPLADGLAMKVDRHWWGGVFKADEWRCVGFKPSRIKSNNGRRIAVWGMR